MPANGERERAEADGRTAGASIGNGERERAEADGRTAGPSIGNASDPLVIRSLEFLGAVEPWTKVWTDHERKCVSLRYYSYNPRGAVSLLADGAEILFRRLRAKRNEKPAEAPVESDS